MGFCVSVPPLITRIYPSTHQAPPNIKQSEIVISVKLVISEKLSIFAIKSNVVFFILNSYFVFVGDPVHCASGQLAPNMYSHDTLGPKIE